MNTTIPLKVLGNVGNVAEVINREGLNRIIVARSGFSPSEISHCMRVSKRMGVLMSRELDSEHDGAEVVFTSFNRMNLLEVRPVKFVRGVEIATRVYDLIGALGLLLLTFPLLITVACLIKATSKGPVLYRSNRVGKGGRYFTFLKFRTMYIDRERREDLARENEAGGHLFKMKNDPRITPIGRLLRRYSIDELPQLLNVLAGSMSLIGPRPLPAGDLDPDGMSRGFALWAEQRALVRPGITGLWQVSGRSDLEFAEMMALDIDYVQNRSIWLDLKILFATPIAILSARGAY